LESRETLLITTRKTRRTWLQKITRKTEILARVSVEAHGKRRIPYDEADEMRNLVRQ
jgi:hypothetical protein